MNKNLRLFSYIILYANSLDMLNTKLNSSSSVSESVVENASNEELTVFSRKLQKLRKSSPCLLRRTLEKFYHVIPKGSKVSKARLSPTFKSTKKEKIF